VDENFLIKFKLQIDNFINWLDNFDSLLYKPKTLLENPILVNFYMIDLSEYDKLQKEKKNFLKNNIEEINLYQLCKDYTNLRFLFDNIIDYMRVKFKDYFSFNQNEPIKISLIPDDSVQILIINKLVNNDINQIYRIKGILVAKSLSFIISKYTYTCSFFNNNVKCNFKKTTNEIIKKCPLCSNSFSKADIIESKKTYQDIKIQKISNDSENNEVMNAKLEIKSEDKFSYSNYVGKKLDVVGYIKTKKIFSKSNNENRYVFYMYILNIIETEMQELSKKRVAQIKEFINTNSEDMVEVLCNDIFRNHKGHDNEKKALLITALGLNKSKQIFIEDIDSIRKEEVKLRNHQMVCVMIGNPATGKSSLALTLSSYFYNAGYASHNMTEAGLTIGIDKTENNTMLQLGVVPFANESLCVIDEIGTSKNPDVFDCLLTPISESKIILSKIKKAEFDIFVNFILCGNPRNGMFDTSTSFYSQIDLKPPFLDRADFICKIEDFLDSLNEIDYNNFMDVMFLNNNNMTFTNDDVFLKDIMFYIKNFVPNPKIPPEVYDYFQSIINQIREAFKIESQFDMDDGKNHKKTISSRSVISIYKIAVVIGRIKGKEFLSNLEIDQAKDIYFKTTLVPILSKGQFNSIEDFSSHINKSSKVKIPKSITEIKDFIISIFSIDKNKSFSKARIYFICNDRGVEKPIFNKVFDSLAEDGTILQRRSVNGQIEYALGIDCVTEEDKNQMEDFKNNITEFLTDWVLNNIQSQIDYEQLLELAKTKNKNVEEVEKIINTLIQYNKLINEKGILKKL